MLQDLQIDQALRARDLPKDQGWRAVAIAAALFFTIVLLFSIHRYLVFNVDSDHGIFSQVFWNNAHGRWFESSLSSTHSVSVNQDGAPPTVFYRRLAQHFTPALLLWAPLYLIFPSPITLIVLKVALVTAGGLVLYGLGRQYLAPALAAAISLSYYGANTVIGPAIGAEFYDFCQLPLFVFGALLALEKRHWWGFGLLCAFTLAVREDAGLTVFGIGLYLIISKRYPRLGLVVSSLSFLYMLVVTAVLMPLFTDEISRRFMIEEFGNYTNNQAASTPEVIWAIATQPLHLLQALVSPVNKTVQYLLGHWLPLAFVPALSLPAWLISGFPLLENLLRKGDAPLSINIRYTTAVVPGLFYGAILWWAAHANRFKPGFKRFWALCLALSLLFTFTSNPGRAWSFILPDSIKPLIYVSLPQQWDHAGQIRSLLVQIPDDASVAASRYIVPHLPNRRAVLGFPMLRYRNEAQQVLNVDYVAIDFWYPRLYQSAFRAARKELQKNVPAIDRVLQRGKYGVVDFKDGVLLLQRGAAVNATAQAEWVAYRQQLDPLLQQK